MVWGPPSPEVMLPLIGCLRCHPAPQRPPCAEVIFPLIGCLGFSPLATPMGQRACQSPERHSPARPDWCSRHAPPLHFARLFHSYHCSCRPQSLIGWLHINQAPCSRLLKYDWLFGVHRLHRLQGGRSQATSSAFSPAIGGEL